MVRGDWVDPDAGKITFGEYADWWIEQRPVRPRTTQTHEGHQRHITPTFPRREAWPPNRCRPSGKSRAGRHEHGIDDAS